MSPWILLAACSSEPSDTHSAPIHTGLPPGTTPTGLCEASDTDGLGPGPDFEGRSGELVIVSETASYASFSGSFLDRPRVDLHVEADRSGQCRLLTYTGSTCSPACQAGVELCVDGACVTQERIRPAGDLVLSGVVPEPLSVSPDGTGAYWADFDPVDGDATLEVLGGGSLDGVTARSCRVGPVGPASDWSTVLADRGAGEDVELTWTHPNPEARIRLRMTTGVATHGGVAHAEVECEGPDTGSLVLPGPFLDELYSEGWACGECGDNTLLRYRAGRIGDSGARLVQEAKTHFWYIPR